MSAPRSRFGLLAVILLAGCHESTNPAPIYDGGNGGQRPLGPVNTVPVTQAGILETAGGRATVQQGETLYAISRRSGVPVRSLIDANNLQPPYRVQAGQVLTLPRTRQHIVQQGETLYSVARRYDVEAASLARTNHIDPPYTIKLGQPLILPPSVAEVAEVAPTPSALPPAGAQPVGPAPVVTAPTVPAGGSATATALPPPPTSVPTPTGPPQSLTPPAAPVAAPVPPPLPQRPVPVPVPVAPPPESVPEPAPSPAAVVSPPEPESAAPVPAPASHALPAAPTPAVSALVEAHRAPTGPLFGWPVSGQIVSTFGPAAGGTHNDGINISAPEGTTVAAAESGTVAYAGNELRGFGNLLLLKHDGGWVTAYAHNQVLLVKKGDKVRRGQAIARVGSTGGVGAPQLHFELRSGTKAVDPLDHLPQLTAGN
ncbi:MAG TPA: LysM peptidoglycan-binding domain-containing M23 family metallopeptidase [Aliidongia sp.]|uniref:LysM peptidoglycan-binding domain-containing M23 family metallopeptidase n=1 Tax=Aliidongia sp. TaxID=1914230 RepID=UPI002DDD33BF|nr:LysM peptidoglycan-binding domain-containing M23 family metallopeptidase [Aliidongia sp.]HEV2673219.1 LysM peptidoglycan-binding domain-containing M23 family metallopeptidase [Aliidongia sp.]